MYFLSLPFIEVLFGLFGHAGVFLITVDDPCPAVYISSDTKSWYQEHVFSGSRSKEEFMDISRHLNPIKVLIGHT